MIETDFNLLEAGPGFLPTPKRNDNRSDNRVRRATAPRYGKNEVLDEISSVSDSARARMRFTPMLSM